MVERGNRKKKEDTSSECQVLGGKQEIRQLDVGLHVSLCMLRGDEGGSGGNKAEKGFS